MICYRGAHKKNFTMMNNSFGRDPTLTEKAKAVMFVILSLPDDWRLTIESVLPFLKGKRDSIRSAFRELEDAGYLERYDVRDQHGRFTRIEYIVYEEGKNTAAVNRSKSPVCSPSSERRDKESGVCENDVQTPVKVRTKPPPEPVLPGADFPIPVLPRADFPAQTNTEITDNTVLNKYRPILSPRTDASSVPGSFSTDTIRSDKKSDRKGGSVDFKELTEAVKEQINYAYLLDTGRIDKDFLDTVVTLITEVFLSKEQETTVAREARPVEYVKERFLQLESDHIEYVFDRMNATETTIKNIRQYLRAALFNAPATMGTYYYRRVDEDQRRRFSEGAEEQKTTPVFPAEIRRQNVKNDA